VAKRVNDLERYERTYRALAAELAAELDTVGFISPGSVVTATPPAASPAAAAWPTRRNATARTTSGAVRSRARPSAAASPK